MTFITIFLAALGLTFLIFIHELGHYFVARREGMKVEVFSIGFGPAFFSFTRKGVRWQFCYVLIGGYVKVSGMEKEGEKEPYEVENGFYSKKPWARIKMAAMGPIVNLIFAFFAFTLIWACGGRAKPFSDFTHLTGWVKEESPAGKSGIRAGDRTTQINDKPYIGKQDLLYASITENPDLTVQGDHINYYTSTETPFSLTFAKGDEEFSLAYMMGPAELLRFEESKSASLSESGIEKGDRILWADGKLIFSMMELQKLILENRALLTIERRGDYVLERVSRMPVREIKFSSYELGELDDRQHALGIRGDPGDLYSIPYAISSNGVVERALVFLDDELQETTASGLQLGDRIVAIDGQIVSSSLQILQRLQTRHLQLIVQRDDQVEPLTMDQADHDFINSVDWKAIPQITETIGLPYPKQTIGKIHLLKPIALVPLKDLPMGAEMQSALEERRGAISKIKDSKKRLAAVTEFEANTTRPTMGAQFSEQQVLYNPNPVRLFKETCLDTYRTLGALVTGYLKPKYLSGPVGIVHIVQNSVSIGWKEALFFLGLISLNLGVFNLLPIPVLDGGHILFSIIESIRKKPMKAKTMERLIIPFIVLMLIFFVFVTYQDVTRIFK